MTEEDIQRTFINWHNRTHRYKEEFVDPNGGAGALVDSAGFVGQIPQLIEFKISIKNSGITYESNRVSSIEKKIRDSIERLHQNRLLKTEWTRKSLPMVWIIAENISGGGKSTLNELCECRSLEWCFTYEVGLWDGHVYRDLLAGPKTVPALKPLSDLNLPLMSSPPTVRNRPRGPAEQREIARERGVQQLFDFAISLTEEIALKPEYKAINNITLTASTINIGAIWPIDSSNKKGLCVAVKPDRVLACFNVVLNPSVLPGIEAPSRGFLGDRRFLRSFDEIKEFFEIIAGRDRKRE